MKTIKTSELTRAAADLPAERYFTVVYKLTDANTAKYLSNRDWVTYVYADSMAELASLKELSAEPAGAVYAELPEPDARMLAAPAAPSTPASGGWISVERHSDQSVLVVFPSCRLASEFERSLSPASPTIEGESK